LRTREGFDLKILGEGSILAEKLLKLEELGLIVAKNGRILPTKKGFLVADNLPLQLLEP
jgi:hypothetical protein